MHSSLTCHSCRNSFLWQLGFQHIYAYMMFSYQYICPNIHVWNCSPNVSDTGGWILETISGKTPLPVTTQNFHLEWYILTREKQHVQWLIKYLILCFDVYCKFLVNGHLFLLSSCFLVFPHGYLKNKILCFELWIVLCYINN